MKTWKSGATAVVNVAVAMAVVGSLSMSGCKRLGGGATPSTEDEKTLYTLGMLLGRNLGTFNLTAGELELVKSGLTDMVLKKEHKVDLDKYGPKVDALARKRGQERVEIEKAQAKTYLDQAGRESGAGRDAVGDGLPHRDPRDRRDPDADRSGQRAVRRAPHRRNGLRQHQEARRRTRRPSPSTASSSAGPRASGG